MHKKVFEKAMIDMQKRITELTQLLKEKDTEIKLQAQKIRDVLSLDKVQRANIGSIEYQEIAKHTEPWRIHTTDQNAQKVLDR